MKTSASLFFTDILPHKRRLYHKIIKSKVFDHSPAKEVFAKLKAAGMDGVELILPSFQKASDEDLHEVKKLLDECKMPVFSVHQVIRFITKTRLAEIVELFHIADSLGAKVIVLHMNSAGKQVLNKDYIKLVHSLENKYGITVGFENREKFFGSLHRGYGWHEDKFAKLMKDNNFNITLDTTHLAHSGGDIVDFFEKNKDRIVNIHLSDYRPHILNGSLRPLRYKHLPLGKGILPIEKFLRAVKKDNYKGLMTMEINGSLDALVDSAGIISSIFNKKS